MKPPSLALRIALSLTEVLLALLFVGTGLWKLSTPLVELGAVFPWMGESPPALVYGTGVFDVLGGLGILLPTLSRVRPTVALWAALGCIALQLSAILFHLWRGEAGSTPFNVLLVALSAFVYWARRWRVPVAPRA